jgi:3-oxoacyl-[acyl-carrier protein] reductase
MPAGKKSEPQLPLEGRIAVVTGATRGIGHAIVQELIAAKCRVFGLGRDRKALASLQKLLREGGEALACDVGDEQAVHSTFSRIASQTKKIDFLINNAGVAQKTLNVDRMPYETWRKVLTTNLDGIFLVTRAALPLLRKGSVIVNNISVSAFEPFAGFAAYNASKAGAFAFTNSLREELRSRGIRVTALVPGATATEIWNQFWPDAPREKMVPPETIAKLVAHILQAPPMASIDRVDVLSAAGNL